MSQTKDTKISSIETNQNHMHLNKKMQVSKGSATLGKISTQEQDILVIMYLTRLWAVVDSAKSTIWGQIAIFCRTRGLLNWLYASNRHQNQLLRFVLWLYDCPRIPSCSSDIPNPIRPSQEGLIPLNRNQTQFSS